MQSPWHVTDPKRVYILVYDDAQTMPEYGIHSVYFSLMNAIHAREEWNAGIAKESYQRLVIVENEVSDA